MPGIPFHLPDEGLREISGKIFLDDEYLILEVQDALMGEFDKEHQVIKVDPAALDEIHLERGVVRDRLFIRPRKNDLLEAMPGKHGVELPLKIWRKHRRRLEDLVDEVKRRKMMSGAR